MIVVPKPNPLNINRLGHAHSHHYSVPYVPASMVPSSTAPPAPIIVQKRARNDYPNSRAQNSPKNPIYSHKHSNSRVNLSPTSPSFNTSPSYPTFHPNAYSKHRHMNSSNGTQSSFPYNSVAQFVNASITGVGLEFEMALDLSDMSPPTTPSPKTRTPSPSSFSPISPVYGYGTPFSCSHPSGGNLFASSFPNTPVPAPIPTHPTHTRAPSAPVFHNHTHSASSSPSSPSSPSSFERDRYASSTWQNSPPAATLPKPKFLDDDVFN